MRFSLQIGVYILITLLFFSVVTISTASHEDAIPYWDRDWSFRQELILPISTADALAYYQPIDIRIQFENPCWTMNTTVTSVRICCWDGTTWHELESQIYDINSSSNYITECCVVFLVPDFADGNEHYFVYYDDSAKSAPRYKDHVTVEDAFYSSSPIADISTEAKYYCVLEEGYCVYGVGQEGKLLDRPFSQIVVKQKKNTKEFNALNSDQIASFAFSYYYGSNEEDESSSDQSFIHKKIFTDGNLMVEFGIISQSNRKDIRTTAVYKYYYSPLDDKKISVHVEHKLSEEVVVKGKENIDGRFGSLISIKSRNSVIDKLNFGEILPYLHFYAENDQIIEYEMNQNPESKSREWIISYKDDADLGKESWIAYGDGKTGVTNALIFSSSEGIIKSGTNERDGIQLKVAEKEYFDFLGTEVDYASINFGRNSYEVGRSHDLTIPENLIIEFEAELFSSLEGGYEAAHQESHLYQELVKHRHQIEDPSFETQQKKYDLGIITHFGGTRFSFPLLSNRTGGLFPVMWIDLYKDGNLLISAPTNRSFFFRPLMLRSYKIFHDIPEGEYLIKVFFRIGNETSYFNGVDSLALDRTKKIHIFCTWQRQIKITFQDQHGDPIEDISFLLRNKEDVILTQENTDETGSALLEIPLNLREPYILQAYYHDFLIVNEEIQTTFRNIEKQFELELYDLTIDLKDILGFPPGVEVTPFLEIMEQNSSIQLTPEEIQPGIYLFSRVPSRDYVLKISYSSYYDEYSLHIPHDGDRLNFIFSASADINVDLFDARGNNLADNNIEFVVQRQEKNVLTTNDHSFTLPPAKYKIYAYENGKLIGAKEVELLRDTSIQIVTSLSSILPLLLISAILILFGFFFVLLLLKKVTLILFIHILIIGLVIIAIMQPWWGLDGSNKGQESKRDIRIYLNPEVMIEKIEYDHSSTADIAEMPQLYIEFLEKIILLLTAICLLIVGEIIFSFIKKNNLTILLSLIVALLLCSVLSLFYIGTSKLTEISIGDVQGEGILDVTVNSYVIPMHSTWGFTSGYYLLMLAVTLAFLIFFEKIRITYLKQKKL